MRKTKLLLSALLMHVVLALSYTNAKAGQIKHTQDRVSFSSILLNEGKTSIVTN